MTEDKEIRLAITHIREGQKNTTHYKEAIQTLLALAERYLQVGEMLPEKYTEDCDNHQFAIGYNLAIDDCQLAYTKQMTERLEGLEDVLIKSEEEYADSFEKGKLLAPTRVHYLARVIRNHIANVSKKVGDSNDNQ